ncbi:MAG: hypothetical protein JJT93_10655 [Gammaproteobacteria bacterium]|nr:hypothetical protein [Gammaproteobacteria bacterium]
MNAHRLPPTDTGPRAWLTRVLAAIGAAGALIVSFFLGALVFVTALGLFVLIAIGVAIRIWWLRRQFRDQMEAWERGERGADGDDVIDVEYTVVERRERKHGERRQE